MKAILPGGYERLSNVAPSLIDQTMADAFNPEGSYAPDPRSKFIPWVNAALQWQCWDDVTRIRTHWRSLAAPTTDGAA